MGCGPTALTLRQGISPLMDGPVATDPLSLVSENPAVRQSHGGSMGSIDSLLTSGLLFERRSQWRKGEDLCPQNSGKLSLHPRLSQ